MLHGNRIDNEIEAGLSLRHGLRVRRGEEPIRAERERLSLFIVGPAHDGHIGAHGDSELDRHVAQPAEADDATRLPGPIFQVRSGE